MIIYIPFIFIEYGAHSENGNQIDHEYLIAQSYANYFATSGNKTTFT